MSTIQAVTGISSRRLSAALFAAMLGALFIAGTGFAAVGHDIAHDTRHAFSFPCH